MPILSTCPSCQKSFMAKDELAGQTVQCPNCSGALAVPFLAAGNAVPPAVPFLATGNTVPPAAMVLSAVPEEWQGPAAADATETVGASKTISRYINFFGWLFYVYAALCALAGLIAGIVSFYQAANVRYGSSGALVGVGFLWLVGGSLYGLLFLLIGKLLFVCSRWFGGMTRLLAHGATSLRLIQQRLETDVPKP